MLDLGSLKTSVNQFKIDKNSPCAMGSELLELVAAERCEGRQYKQGQKWLRKVHGQQVLEWMLEGLSRYVLFKIPSTMILGTVKVQGESFAESGVGPIFLLTTTAFCHCEK